MRASTAIQLTCALFLGATALATSPAAGQSPAELLYSPDRFMQTPALHPGFRLAPPTGAPTPEAAIEPQVQKVDEEDEIPTKPVTLRAGIVEEIIDEPGKIRTGEVTWAVENSVTGERMARGQVRIGKAAALELTIGRRHPASGSITIVVTASQGLGFQPASMSTPRLRRTAAAEGEPLFGRILKGGSNQFVFELSDQAVDIENNRDRLLTRPWLDLIFRGKDGDEVIVTLELGRSGAAILKAAIS